MPDSGSILETAARDGSLDIAEWPAVLESLLQRLHHIVYNEFPLPPSPAPLAPANREIVSQTPPAPVDIKSEAEILDHQQQSQEPPRASPAAPSASQDSTKENDAPQDTSLLPSHGTAITVPFGYEVDTADRTTDGLLDGTADPPLPPELMTIYKRSTRTLQSEFAQSPPYTIQRLAELIVNPRRHYRFLPSYLNAVDRTISVSSPLSDFPLHTLHSSTSGGFLTNGQPQTNGISERDGLGSDASLGGALLTPIPWLHNRPAAELAGHPLVAGNTEGELHRENTETIDGPYGAGSIETVSVTVNGISSTSATMSGMSHQPPASSDENDANGAPTSDLDLAESSPEAHLREQGGITQGELLRQEQEAGVIPAVVGLADPMHTRGSGPRRILGSLYGSGGGYAATDAIDEFPGHPSDRSSPPLIDSVENEVPHVRGPAEIGMEDMGPQPSHQNPLSHTALSATSSIDLDAALGRRRSKSPQPPLESEPPPPSAPDLAPSKPDSADDHSVEGKQRPESDTDGDVALPDATSSIAPNTPPPVSAHAPEPGDDDADDSSARKRRKTDSSAAAADANDAPAAPPDLKMEEAD